MKKANIALFMLAALLAIYQMAVGQTITYDTAYYRNRTIMQVNIYSDNVRVERCFYYPTGELQLDQEFDAETGLQTGDEFWWFRNRVLEHSSEWKAGFAHGWAFTWSESKDLLPSQIYVENRLVPSKDYSRYIPEPKEEIVVSLGRSATAARR